MTSSEWERRVDAMSPAHGVALRLRRAGYEDVVIATALGVPVESVAALLLVAQGKFDGNGDAVEEAEPVVDH
ncbi:hypothetical protein O9K63_02690 [Janibacter cremeus]|uniref:hypothetical protein n=1 Tax=Janibacter cremeus TaxID=1285192 RepID=UPI0023F95541|nr:hypothetical protein [Janibacter cremeus]WEV78719.1 hypothetical protein O9K63_02690 [Janibacter cremeus]